MGINSKICLLIHLTYRHRHLLLRQHMLLLLPLLLTIRGLIADQRYTYQWLSLVLVIFIGASTTEVVASLRAEPAAIVVMIASVAELLSVLVLIRSAQPRRLE